LAEPWIGGGGREVRRYQRRSAATNLCLDADDSDEENGEEQAEDVEDYLHMSRAASAQAARGSFSKNGPSLGAGMPTEGAAAAATAPVAATATATTAAEAAAEAAAAETERLYLQLAAVQFRRSVSSSEGRSSSDHPQARSGASSHRNRSHYRSGESSRRQSRSHSNRSSGHPTSSSLRVSDGKTFRLATIW